MSPTDRDLRPAFDPWIHGVDSFGAGPFGAGVAAASEPPLQAQRFSDNTWVLRQSKTVDYEGPFLYLLFGDRRAFLLDTGATADAAAFPLRAAIDELVANWVASHPCDDYELIVGHSHEHGDHIAGDGQFAGRPHTVVVGTDAASVRSFYGFDDALANAVTLDLGGRTLELLRIPGHDATSVAIFDGSTGWLLTGDTVYPGRLYVQDPPAFVASIARLAEFARARPVTAVMGCHIEMTATPGVDYPQGTAWQPNEAGIAMTVAQLDQLQSVSGVALRPGRHVFDDFIIVAEG